MLCRVLTFKMLSFTNTVVLYAYIREYLNDHMMLIHF